MKTISQTTSRRPRPHVLANAATSRISSSPPLRVSLSSFNPALPLDGSLIVADVLRDQFNALNDDIQTRATEAQLSAEVVALESAIAHCVPESEFDNAVSGLTAQIDQRATQTDLNNAVNALNEAIGIRVTHTELNDAVDGLNAAIDQRITQAELNAGIDTATNNAINSVLPQTSNVSNGVNTLSMYANAYYDQNQIQQMIEKIDELITALRRS